MKQLLIIALLLSSLAPRLPAQAEPPRVGLKEEPKEPPRLSTGERIEIPDVGFSIVPPNGWMVNRNSHGSSLLFEAPKQPNQSYMPTIQVMVFSQPRYVDEVTQKEYGDLIVEKFGKLSNRVTGYHLRSSEIVQMETGDPAILYYTEFQYDDVPIMQMHILISSATDHFLMSYTDVAKVFEDDNGSPALGIAYASMHSAQLASQPHWRWRGFVITGIAVFLVLLGWFTMRFMRARKLSRLGQRIEEEDSKEDEESQYYSRHTGVSESSAGDDEWSDGKSGAKGKSAAPKVSHVHSSHFDDDDEPEVSEVVPISALEKSLHPGRRRREQTVIANPKQASGTVPEQTVPVAPPAMQQPMQQGQQPPPMPQPGQVQQQAGQTPGHVQSAQPAQVQAPAQYAPQPGPAQYGQQDPGQAPYNHNAQGQHSVQGHPGQPQFAQQPAPVPAQQPSSEPFPQAAPAPMTSPSVPVSVHSQPIMPPAQPQNTMGQPAHAQYPDANFGTPQHPGQAPQPSTQGQPQHFSQNQGSHAQEAMAHVPHLGAVPGSAHPNQAPVPPAEQPSYRPQTPAAYAPAQATAPSAAPVAQTYAPPPQPVSTPTMPQFAPAESDSDQPITASRQPLSTVKKPPATRAQDIDEDGPEMTEEARLSEILPKAGTIEKSKPKRKGLFWRKKTDDDDHDEEHDDSGEDGKDSWKTESSKKATSRKGRNEDEDEGAGGDQWAVEPTKKSTPSRLAEKDEEEPDESAAWAPEATKKSEPKKDSLLNETQGPRRLAGRPPQGPVTKENNAAVTEDGWNLNQEVASDHDEEDEEEVS